MNSHHEETNSYGGVKITGTEEIRQFEVPGLAQYSYVIASGGDAVVIDAARDFDIYTRYAAEHGLRITHVTETHIHADFASGSSSLAAAIGAELAVSAYDQGEIYSYAMPHRRLKDGDPITIGRLRLQALHTPGHTPEHLSFVLFDQEQDNNAPKAIFTGDFIFTGSLGRPDLLGEDAKVALAHDLYRSVHQRIAHLTDAVTVYPGHGAGSLCGAGIGSSAQSTLGHERAAQPLFHLGEEEFVKEILDTVPPLPAYYPRMKRLNSAGAAAYSPAAPIEQIDPLHLPGSGSCLLLDTRDVEAFSSAHIPGAINLGAGANLPLWAGWLLESQTPIVLIDQDGNPDETAEARRILSRVGLDNIAGMLAGGMTRWVAEGHATGDVSLLTPEQLTAVAPNTLLLDVRNQDEFLSGHIAGATSIPLGDLPARVAGLPKDREIITICGSGYRASAAASLILATGRRASVLNGGMGAWNQRHGLHN